jgi:hypothetical protein
VKKIIAILLLSVHLFSATEIKVLLKISSHVQHLRETKLIDDSISCFHFLVLHHFTNNFAQDNNSDTQLPAKSDQILTDDSSSEFINNHTSPFTFKSFDQNECWPLIKGETFVIANYHGFVWHPPQLSQLA